MALGEELRRQNWNEVYLQEDPNKAYEVFLKLFNTLYDKCRPFLKLEQRKLKLNIKSVKIN